MRILRVELSETLASLRPGTVCRFPNLVLVTRCQRSQQASTFGLLLLALFARRGRDA
jgi:hypothetical protein